MNTNAIRDVATRARRQLMEAVERRCLLYGIEEGAQGDVETVNGRVLSAAERTQRRELLRIQEELRADGKPGTGHAALVEQAAYTWFNRLFAIRFMELNDRLPSHVRMLSAPDGSFTPECLREAMDLPLEALDRDEAARLVAEGDDEGLFRLIILAQCAELAECMPVVFEKVGSAMELLLPDGLLAKDGVVESLVTGIPEDDWRKGVEIVGWAYQFYVSERKDEFFKSKRKAGRNDIAPATQLFTPEYIVRFLVQNSLGRLWMLNNPSSSLAEEMEYFVKPDPDSHEDFREVTSPEEITLIDPACGSGHFLCYAFDLLARMYEERGYRGRDIARLILEKNLTGVEIDRRAASLTSFALSMKACEWDARFLRRGLAPKVVCIESVDLTPEEREVIEVSADQQALVDVLAHLGEVGSLWQPTSEDVAAVDEWSRRARANNGLFASAATEKLGHVQKYLQVLCESRLVCATNPPYMGSGNLNPWLNGWVRKNYPNERYDLCTCFIARGLSLIGSDGYNAQITMQSWMFIGSYQGMRTRLLSTRDILVMAHLGAHAFGEIGGEVVSTTAAVLYGRNCDATGCYLRLTGYGDESQKAIAMKTAHIGADSAYRYSTSVASFKDLPGNPIGYWASESLRRVFREAKPFGDSLAMREGIHTAKNEFFLRLWWEIDGRTIVLGATSLDDIDANGRWVPYCKGGQFRKWYGNNEYVIGFDASYRDQMQRLPGCVWPSQSLWFREGGTWTAVSTGDLSVRYYPDGFLFDAGGQVLVGENCTEAIAALNSSLYMRIAELTMPTLNYKCGVMKTLPDIRTNDIQTKTVAERCIALSKIDWDSSETSWDFTTHPLVRGNRISSAYGLWSTECKDRFDTLKSNEELLNGIFARVHHMEGEVAIGVEDDKVSVRRADLSRDVRSLISYAVGCMFGRFSLDKPGLVLANQGDGLGEYLAQVPHPRYMPDEDGILPITDDEYFEDDIVSMFCEFLKAAYGAETLEENLQFVAGALDGAGPARKVIRDYFMNQFFADHCATYSVPSAGKRPIYWLLDSGKLGGFRALVYMHRYTPDLLARVRTDYAHERQERYRSRIAELGREREGASRREQSAIDKELKRLRAQLDEVTKFEERLHHLADQMIEIDLDDGFKANYAKFADVMAKVK